MAPNPYKSMGNGTIATIWLGWERVPQLRMVTVVVG